jgi:4-diphosphocytidyl-2-C-methyl-D-erythritol kinase
LTRGYGRGGVRLELKKNIPVAAGLGGGSSDGACCLLALNHLFKTGLRDDVLRSLAAELGSDAPFFIEGGIALCTERGDVVKQLPQAPPFSGIVAAPGAALNTGKMYSLLSREDQGGPGVEKMLNAITNGNLSRVCSALFNTFQKLALREVPEVGELTKKLRDLGSMGTVLCGSGPTVLGIFAQAKEADTAFRQLMADKNKKAAFAALISAF